MKQNLTIATAAALAAMLALSSGGYAAKGGIPGKPGGGGGGGGEEETAAQNLSVPTIMIGTPVAGLVCGIPVEPSDLVPPTADPLTGYDVPGFYYVQKVHTWQAQCFNDDAALVLGNWGDNLEGTAKLQVGKPIRVELVLTNMGEYQGLTTLQGFTVIKLEPSKLDRESAYGHAALAVLESGFTDDPTNFPQAQWLVHDAGITFSVENLATGDFAVQPGTSPTAEINATGKVVYGYNLRVTAAGTYRITFTTTDPVQFTGVDAGGQIDVNNVYIDINVTAGGSGGGKGGGKK